MTGKVTVRLQTRRMDLSGIIANALAFLIEPTENLPQVSNLTSQRLKIISVRTTPPLTKM